MLLKGTHSFEAIAMFFVQINKLILMFKTSDGFFAWREEVYTSVKMESGLLADSAGHVYKTVLNFDVTIDSDISSGLLDLEKMVRNLKQWQQDNKTWIE